MRVAHKPPPAMIGRAQLAAMGRSEAEPASKPVQLDRAMIDEIAVRISDAIVALVIEMLRARPGEDADALWTARQVAAHYRVRANFVYGHANELGCIRLGSGPCARLRFDPQVVRDRWSTVGRLPDPTRRIQQSAGSRRRTGDDSNNRSYELLGFDREP